MKKYLITFLLVVSFLAGQGTAPTVHVWHGLETIQLVHDEGVPESVEAWKVEIARRFPDAFVLFSHGGDNDKGVWTCYAEPGSKMRGKPVQQVADELHAKFPDRKIVLIMCNPGHHRITTPNVYYALDSVWFETDRSTDATERARAVPEFVGNIFEFVTGDGR
jgi:hypothetical protein